MVSKHWSPLQKALIGEVKRYYPPVYGKALHKPTANPICNWKAIAVNLGSTSKFVHYVHSSLLTQSILTDGNSYKIIILL